MFLGVDFYILNVLCFMLAFQGTSMCSVKMCMWQPLSGVLDGKQVLHTKLDWIIGSVRPTECNEMQHLIYLQSTFYDKYAAQSVS